MPDISGLAWIEDDLFLAVNDGKPKPGQPDLPRVSLVRLPSSNLEGVTWQPLNLTPPAFEGPIRDLESISRLPGDQGFLLAESDGRIFHVVLRDGRLILKGYSRWPVPVENVEATEVVQVGQQLVFLYAERADGVGETTLRWAPMSLNPLKFGAFREVPHKAIDPVGKNTRAIVALAADQDGVLYTASSYDPGVDGGPFRSVVWRIGKVTTDGGGQPLVVLSEPTRLGTLDGLKVESLAVRETPKEGKQLYIGTDDENYGGILRLLPFPAR